MAFKIDAGLTVYQLVVDAIEGDVADYGAPSFCKVGNEQFMAMVEQPAADGEQPTDISIYKVTPVCDVPTVELVEFDEDSEGEEEEGEEGEEEIEDADPDYQEEDPDAKD
jgi:uncharacterized protein YuzB (UPF0349 family)